MLGQAHDRGRGPGLERSERFELPVLSLFEVRIDRPAVGTALGMAELLLDPLDHLVAERPAELVCVDVRLRRGVAHEVGEQSLDDAVLADDPAGPLGSGLGQDRLLVLAALDEPLGLEPLQHLARGRPRDPEHFCHAGRQRGRAGSLRPVLADREGEEVDRLEVLVDGMTLAHHAPQSRGRAVV